MTLDHIDAVFFDRKLGWLTEVGRLTMPLFAAVLAYNLARPGALERGVYGRVLQRLGAFGLLAYPWHVMAFGQGFATLNIMFAFGLGVVGVWAVDRRQPGWPLVLLMVVLLSYFVEFRAAGPLLVVGFWMLFRDMRSALFFLPLGMGLLVLQNGNLWALWALPLIGLLLFQSLVTRRASRAAPWQRWAFYAYYPVHLVVLTLVAQL